MLQSSCIILNIILANDQLTFEVTTGCNIYNYTCTALQFGYINRMHDFYSCNRLQADCYNTIL